MGSTMMSTTGARGTTSIASRLGNIALWLLQVLLAALFAWHGQLMTFPPAELVAMIDANIGPNLRVFIGVAELLAAVGLLLPGITRILPSLTAVSAGGLTIVMACATALHLFRGETASAISAAVILVLVVTVAYARWKLLPIAPRRRA